jgi:hypothetical protein
LLPAFGKAAHVRVKTGTRVLRELLTLAQPQDVAAETRGDRHRRGPEAHAPAPAAAAPRGGRGRPWGSFPQSLCASIGALPLARGPH